MSPLLEFTEELLNISRAQRTLILTNKDFLSLLSLAFCGSKYFLQFQIFNSNVSYNFRELLSQLWMSHSSSQLEFRIFSLLMI